MKLVYDITQEERKLIEYPYTNREKGYEAIKLALSFAKSDQEIVKVEFDKDDVSHLNTKRLRFQNVIAEHRLNMDVVTRKGELYLLKRLNRK